MERHSSWPHRPFERTAQQQAWNRTTVDDDYGLNGGYSSFGGPPPAVAASLGNSITSNSGSTGQRVSPLMFKRLALMPGKDRNWRERHKEVPWAKSFCTENKKKKRVLLVDYIKTDITESGKKMTKVEAKSYEFSNMVDLEAICSLDRKDGSILRVMHVQNFPEAVEFFVMKYQMHDYKNISGWDNIKEWLYHYKPQRRAGKPMPMAKTFKKIHIQGLSKIAWGLDCLKVMKCNYRADDMRARYPDTKIAELMGFIEENSDQTKDAKGQFKPDNPWLSNNDPDIPRPPTIQGPTSTDPDNPRVPHHTHDVFSQRLSVYLQWATGPESRVMHPLVPAAKRQPTDIEDAGATIIIFDNSASLSIEDTVIPGHGEEERIWRGPGVSYYEREDTDIHDDLDQEMHENKFSLDFVQKIVETIFQSVAACWEDVLDVSWNHTSILQDKIYEAPADESRAPELFRNAEMWLKFSKLMSFHTECIGDVQEYIGDFRDEEDSSEGARPIYTWLWSVEQAFQRLSRYIETDLVQQTDKLSDLMYKSVGIRDSRDSLRLGESMWRLSWITFIFLPLTFICGFFGMNVDVFANDPEIKWYFITAVPFMICVFIGLSILKALIARHRPSVHDRGSYESFFMQLQQSNSDLWSRTGPRESTITALGITSKVKWYFIKRWTHNKAMYRSSLDEHQSGWTTFKKYLIARWTKSGELKYKSSWRSTKYSSTVPSTSSEEDGMTSSTSTTEDEKIAMQKSDPVVSSEPDPSVAKSRWRRRHMHPLNTRFDDSTMPINNVNTHNNTTNTSNNSNSKPPIGANIFPLKHPNQCSSFISGESPKIWGGAHGTWRTMNRNETGESLTPPSMRESPVNDEKPGAVDMDRIPSTIKEGEVKTTTRKGAPSSKLLDEANHNGKNCPEQQPLPSDFEQVVEEKRVMEEAPDGSGEPDGVNLESSGSSSKLEGKEVREDGVFRMDVDSDRRSQISEYHISS